MTLVRRRARRSEGFRCSFRVFDVRPSRHRSPSPERGPEGVFLCRNMGPLKSHNSLRSSSHGTAPARIRLCVEMSPVLGCRCWRSHVPGPAAGAGGEYPGADAEKDSPEAGTGRHCRFGIRFTRRFPPSSAARGDNCSYGVGGNTRPGDCQPVPGEQIVLSSPAEMRPEHSVGRHAGWRGRVVRVHNTLRLDRRRSRSYSCGCWSTSGRREGAEL